MPDKLKEYVRQSLDQLLKSLSPEERLKGLSAEEVMKGLPPDVLEALAQRLRANGSNPNSSSEPSHPG